MAMTNEEYQQIQSNLLLVTTFVYPMDLDSFLSCITAAETIAPIVDPTLYRQAGSNLHNIKRLAEGLRKFQKVVHEILDREDDHAHLRQRH